MLINFIRLGISESCDAVDGGGERSEDQKEEESDAGSRKSLRVKQAKEKAVPEPGQGSGGKVLRPPEKKRNDDSSSSSSEDEPEEDKSDVTSSSANEHESSEDDAVDDGIGTDASRTEQLRFLRIVQQRRKKHLKLLQSQVCFKMLLNILSFFTQFLSLLFLCTICVSLIMSTSKWQPSDKMKKKMPRKLKN